MLFLHNRQGMSENSNCTNLVGADWVPIQNSKGTPGFIRGLFKSGAFHVKKRISQNIFLQVAFFLVLTSRTRFRFTDFQFFHKHKKWRRPLLYQLFFKAVHISTMWTQTKWSWPLWLTNDKASYVAKEDSIGLLSVAKEATLNEQWIKPGVPLGQTIRNRPCNLGQTIRNRPCNLGQTIQICPCNSGRPIRTRPCNLGGALRNSCFAKC